jgi:hypothetical protein
MYGLAAGSVSAPAPTVKASKSGYAVEADRAALFAWMVVANSRPPVVGGRTPVEKHAIAAATLGAPVHTQVAWWWFAIGGMLALALIRAPKVLRRRARSDRTR